MKIEVEKKIKQLRSASAKEATAKIRLEGQQLMDLYHQASMTLLEKMIKPFTKIKKDRALDVACGIGNLSKDFLCKKFTSVDLFDSDVADIE